MLLPPKPYDLPGNGACPHKAYNKEKSHKEKSHNKRIDMSACLLSFHKLL